MKPSKYGSVHIIKFSHNIEQLYFSINTVKFTYASGPVIIEEPSDVTSVQGLEVILRCVVENLPLEKDMVQWTKSGFALGFERDLSGKGYFV